MGQCLSEPRDPLIGTNVSVSKEESATTRKQPSSPGRRLRLSKLHIIVDNNVQSPQQTAPMTPAAETPNNFSDSLLQTPDEILGSFRYTEIVVIPEEADDAPSDEEASYQRLVERSHRAHGISDWELEPGPIFLQKPSNSNTSTTGKKHRKRRKLPPQPSSIAYHAPHLIAPPTPQREIQTPDGAPSVERHVLSDFTKLQVQIEMKKHYEKKKRRVKKLEDRYEDVQQHRKLYKEFQQNLIKERDYRQEDDEECSRNSSFGLLDSDSWIIDFGSLAEPPEAEEEEDDDSHYSLLSAASMESQRRYYAAKAEKKSLNEILNNLETKVDSLKHKNATTTANNDYGPSRVQQQATDYGPVYIACTATSPAPPNQETTPQNHLDLSDLASVYTQSSALAAAMGLMVQSSDQEPCRKVTVDDLDDNSTGSSQESRHEEQEKLLNETDAPAYANSNNQELAVDQAADVPPQKPTGEDNEETNAETTSTTEQDNLATVEETSKPIRHEALVRWRTFRDSPKKALVDFQEDSTNIASMTTEEFFQMAEHHALVRISRVPDDEQHEDLLKARRLDFGQAEQTAWVEEPVDEDEAVGATTTTTAEPSKADSGNVTSNKSSPIKGLEEAHQLAFDEQLQADNDENVNKVLVNL